MENNINKHFVAESIIKVRGARQHNLKNISLDIPKNKMVVFTGVSGSGKSSLAFDTIYAEGQRRYVESLSTYARQFLGIMEKPDVDTIEGLSPAISIDQKTTSRNPRSTVGTVTEIYDYLRLLYARIGHPHCPICNREIKSQSSEEIADSAFKMLRDIASVNKKARFMILAPLVNDKKGEYSGLFTNLKSKGFKQVRVDGVVKNLTDDFVLLKTNKHTIDAIVDKISVNFKDLENKEAGSAKPESTKFPGKVYAENLKSRLTDSIEQALKLSEGMVIISEILDKSYEIPEFPSETKDHLFSEKFACPYDNVSIPEIEPRTFSFNSPHGACVTCGGIGKILKVEKNLLLSREISIKEGAILPFANIFEHDTWYSRLLLTVCAENEINPRVPFKELSEEQEKIILYGTGKREYKVEGTNRFGRQTHIFEFFPGIIKELENRHASTESDWVRAEIEKYMRDQVCETCKGTRLKQEALSVTIDGLSIAEISALPINDLSSFIESLMESKSKLSAYETKIGDLIFKEIKTRLGFLKSVGLEYLTIDRTSGTLSGGEAQRIRLASQIGSGLTGVLYVLDEPTIGLHQRDNQRLIDTLKRLRDLGNTVIVVEHDEQTMMDSDYIFDFGPGAGKEGGLIVAEGTPTEIKNNPKSITGRYLSGKKTVDVSTPGENQVLFRPSDIGQDKSEKSLDFYGCSQFNLKDINVSIPLRKFVVITGVSGSGKSTLLVETIYPALEQKLNPKFKGEAGKFKRVEGIENVNKVILIDQSPIGRTPRSNPATYTKIFDLVRDVFADTRESKARGFKKGRFSFNVKGGRCDACEGQGQIKIEMQFMSDLWINCDVCNGRRYNAQTLEVTYKGKNIAEVLSLSVRDAVEFFHNHRPIVSKLETLQAVGLGYMELGQPATTLSGGEAQRIKLSSELSKRDTGDTVYILDEPTTGLHFADVEKLLKVLKLLVARGNTVIVIEHNTDVIKNADYIVDLGPEGGDMGGNIVARGSVKDIIKSQKSYTGQFLAANPRG